MQPFLLKCLGVGDGAALSDRSHSSFLYRFGETRLLVDCGEPAARNLALAGVTCDEIDRLLISHLHFDHAGGFFMLIQGWLIDRRRKELSVHAPGYAIDPLREMLNAGYTFEELLPFRVSFEPWRVHEAVALPGVRVTALPTTHLEALRLAFERKYPQPFEAFSFLFETERLRIGHSGDIGALTDLSPLLEKPLDLLVCEVAHVEPVELFAYLNGRSIRRVVFVHVARQHWKNLKALESLASETLRDVPFTFASDGDEIAL